MATIDDPWPKKSWPDGHPADGMTLYVPVGDGAQMTIADPRSFREGGLAWIMRYGEMVTVRHAAASTLDSYDYLLSDAIGIAEAIRRLREMRRVRAKAAVLARIEPK